MPFKWLGQGVVDRVVDNVAEAMGEIAYEGELGAKHFLQPGHGVDTGSLKRSIHTATHGYTWSEDHSYPNGPERGGKIIPATKVRGLLWVMFGTGQNYARYVLDRYKFLDAGLLRARLMAKSILWRHRIK